MKKWMYLLAAAALFAFFTESAHAQCGDQSASAKETKLLALTFHADDCGACKKLKPNVAELQAKLNGQPVQWVKFDFTSAESKEESAELAAELDVSDHYKENQATGFVLLVTADTKKQVAKLTSKQSSEEMYQTVRNNL